MKFIFNGDPLNGAFRSNIVSQYPLIVFQPSSVSDQFVVQNIYKMDDVLSHWASEKIPKQWLNIYFLKKKFIITGYSLRSYTGTNLRYQLSNWKFQGSNDNQTWNDLDYQNDPNLLASTQAKYFPIDNINNTVPYSIFRIFMNGKTLSPDDHLRISTLDLFGELVNKTSYLNHKIEIIYSFFAYLIIVFLVT